MRYFKIIIFTFVFNSSLVFCEDPAPFLTDSMFKNLDTIENLFSINYAPSEWKKAQYGWDLKEEIEKIKIRLLLKPNMSLKEYQIALKDFFFSTKDYHVGIEFFARELASLDFRVKSTKDGRYFINWIAPDANLLFDVGDELIEFDSLPVQEAIDGIKEEMGGGSALTDQAFAEVYLTLRPASRGFVVPKGKIPIKIRKKNNAILTYTLAWNYTGEQINAPVSSKTMAKFQIPLRDVPKKKIESFFMKEMKGFMAPLAKLNEDEDSSFLGSRKSFVPPLGEVLWQSSAKDSFHAYVFKGPREKVVGYIRIPSYVGFSEEAEDFEKFMNFFEHTTDCLVIDQVDNPGGIIFHLYGLLSMLTDKPLRVPFHREMITQENVDDALFTLAALEKHEGDEDLYGYVIKERMFEKVKKYASKIIEQWDQGKQFTDPMPFFGIDTIEPHPRTRYTKPILVLINELDLSAADFFPAIMQDEKRAVCFGEKTAGAGGVVRAMSLTNNLGISSMHWTASFAERKSRLPLENLGVTPDIPYSITVEDLQHNYSGYVQAVWTALEELR